MCTPNISLFPEYLFADNEIIGELKGKRGNIVFPACAHTQHLLRKQNLLPRQMFPRLRSKEANQFFLLPARLRTQELFRETMFPRQSSLVCGGLKQRERHKTIGLMSKTIALHVRSTFWYISLPSSAKQRRAMTKF